MAEILISDDEDDIWNYKFGTTSKSKKKVSGEERCSKAKNLKDIDTKEKDDVSLGKREQNAMVIDIDSDDDFPFTSIKPINNEKSSVQWASMFSNKQEKDNKSVNIHKDKKEIRNNKRKSVHSRTPLKTKTNQPRKNIDLKNSMDKRGQKQDSSLGVQNYLSRVLPKKMKLSLSDEDSSSSSEETCEIIQHSILDHKDKETLVDDDKGDDFGSSALSSSSSIQELKTDHKHLESIGIEKDRVSSNVVNDDAKPKIVDVIILEDENEDSPDASKTYCVDIISALDIDDTMDSDIETAGGFVRDDWESSSHISKTESLQIHSDERLTSSLLCQSSSNDKILDDGLKSDCQGIVTASSIPLSTAARKQRSIFSFFSSKASVSTSKPKNDVVQRQDDVIDSVVKGSGIIPSLAKSLTFPTTKNSSQGGSKQVPWSSSASTSAVGSYGNYQNRGKQRQCPFYKRIPGTSFTVDAFRYGVIPDCNAYFLTHFHYDHYGGLTKKFAQPIYCTKVTGNLVERRLGVDKKWIRRLPMWRPVTVEGVTLTLMEANHCPGAVIVLFETENGKKILHTGDFRGSVEMEDYPALKNIVVDELYLDTTYCNPSYAFPNQRSVIDFAVHLVEKQMAINPNTLVVCGAYTIGKERIFTAIARALDSKICVLSDKKKVLDCLEDDDLKSRVTLNWSEGQVHVLPMAKLKQEPLFEHHSRHSRYTSILAFEPTGWTHSNKSISLESLQPKWSKNGVTLYGVPYSEHSSYLELKRFVQFIRPKKILPTVNNGNDVARRKMESIFQEWLNE